MKNMNEEKLDFILEKIEKIERKVEENNDIIRGDRNSKRWGKLFFIIKWIVIISAGIIAWSYISPIYNSTMEAYDKIIETSNEAKETLSGLKNGLDKIPSTDDFSLEKLKDKFTN